MLICSDVNCSKLDQSVQNGTNCVQIYFGSFAESAQITRALLSMVQFMAKFTHECTVYACFAQAFCQSFLLAQVIELPVY